MSIRIYAAKAEMAAAAAELGAEKIRRALAEKNSANIIIATGASQFEMMSALVRSPGIDWGKITMFHLDEYVGLPETHPASFRKYIKERFVAQLPQPLKAAYFVDGSSADPQKVCNELGVIIRKHPVDVAFIGIGENGHIAFNDPPADFNTEAPYIVVNLDNACRQQQLGEGWFPTIDDVPRQAISMSVRHILKSKAIINTVPDRRKAQAVKAAIEGQLCPCCCPAAVIRLHADCTTFVDADAAALLSPLTRDLCGA